MAMANTYQVREEELQSGLKQLVLEGEGQRVKILPEMGSNLYSFQLDGQELLMEPEDITVKGVKYGIPILFPTPNRVRNGVFRYEGKEYPQLKRGEKRLIHGLVCDEAWSFGKEWAGPGEAKVNTWIESREGHPVYEAFPFRFLLEISYRLLSHKLVLEYRVENRDRRAFPFGFALHPFFRLIDNRKDILIRVPASYVMEAHDCMPTGELIEVNNTPYDLREPRPLEELNLDDVYWKMDAGKTASVKYLGWQKELRLRASDDFSHMVVYTPKHRPCFCLENQTCSTDAHNLYDQGKKDVSGLMILEAGQVHEGWVSFEIVYK
jgi:aldose 1-epimerase